MKTWPTYLLTRRVGSLGNYNRKLQHLCEIFYETACNSLNTDTKKVKQPHYRPGQAQRVPGGWGSQISRQSAHEGCKVVSPAHRPPSNYKYSWYSFLLEAWVDPKAIVRPEGLCQWKIPVTPPGIERATFRLVAQCFNQLRHRVPQVLTLPKLIFRAV
jgi:hypothetical protein